MNRKMLFLLLLAVPVFCACAKTYTYQSYEVIRAFDQVHPGEDIKLLRKDGELIRGTVLQVDGEVMTVATFDKGRKKVRWDEVKVLERVKKAVVVY